MNYLDPENLNALATRIKERGLAHTDRWGLQNDLYALVRGGRLPLAAYIIFLGNRVDKKQG